MKALMRPMLVIASVALMPALMFAGPAAAAKGGNKARVEQCKQSVLTGAEFRNRGQCVSSGAKGVAPPPQLQVLTTTYSCDNGADEMCWGIVAGSGLKPNSVWQVAGFNIAFPLIGEADDSGNVNENTFGAVLDVGCGAQVSHVVATGTTAAGTTISSNPPVNSPCG
jgi:hypothetical protein